MTGVTTGSGPRIASALVAAGLFAAVTLGANIASAAAPPGLAYGGETSQHNEAFFLLSSTRQSIKQIALDWDGACGGEDDFTVNATLGTVRIKPDGSFAKTTRSTEEGDNPGWSDFWTEQITGRVASDRMTGTFHGHLITRRANGSLVSECDSGPVTFKALQ
jgi:hypothetical protein